MGGVGFNIPSPGIQPEGRKAERIVLRILVIVPWFVEESI